jgi:hypothetical protein
MLALPVKVVTWAINSKTWVVHKKDVPALAEDAEDVLYNNSCLISRPHHAP